MDRLRIALQKFVEINDQEWSYIQNQFTLKTFDKKQTIHYSGDVFRQVYYLKSGVARSYFMDLSGKDYTWQLYFRDNEIFGYNHFLEDSVSHYTNEPSLLTFETLTSAEFYVIGVEQLDKMFNYGKKWEYLARMYKLRHFFIPMYQRSLSIITEDAQTRYIRLLKEHPNIFKKVKLHHIASYLGIAPQTLSKIRKKMNLGE
ncbi:MAG: Crp/Fnr family transcriptional regulator [Sulfuricurvum sp.]|nr:Crp/Fnr family transcriptional regulator [Sulfuricurvum sp.]